MPMTSPVKPGRLDTPWVTGVMPGRTLSSSAALRPTVEKLRIWSDVRVALFSPEFRGAKSTEAVTVASSLMPATLRGTVRSERLSPTRSTTPFCSYFENPAVSIVTV